MKLLSKQSLLIFLVPIIFGFVFTYLLQTNLYAYFMYCLLGVVYYVLVKQYGREISFLFIIPLLLIALVLIGKFFILDFFNSNGLNPLKIHPLVLALLIMIYLSLIEDFLKSKLKFDIIVILTMAIISIFFGITLLSRGLSGMAFWFQNYVGPMSFFLFIYVHKSYDLRKLKAYSNFLIFILVIIGLFGIIEYVTEQNLLQTLYDQDTPNWVEGTFTNGYRIKTIIGHPLDNALVFLFSMIFVQINVKNKLLKYICLSLFMIDILVTGSRSIFLLSFFILMYNDSIKEGGWKFIKQYMLFIIPVLTFITALIFSPFGQTFMNRLGDAGASTEARVLIFDYFTKHLFTTHVAGLGGATESTLLFNSRHEPVYLENPWIILFLEVGYAILLYIFYLYKIIKQISHKYLILFFIVGLSALNSFGVKSIDIYLLFYLFAYLYALHHSKEVV